MKIPRGVIGKIVKVWWEDPCSSERIEIDKAPKGKAALAIWMEIGIIDDITDGIVRFRQSEATYAGERKPDEAIFGWVPEDLITNYIILAPEGERHD